MKTTLAMWSAAIVLAAAAPAAAQYAVASSGATSGAAPGWTFTPSMTVTETYDDNVSLFDVHIAPGENNDTVTGFGPGADLRYTGAHTTFGVGYNGSMLAYRTFDTLNRWAQRGELEFKRQQSARLFFDANAHAESVPTTDALIFGGLPYRRTGAKTADARGTVEYRFNARDGVTATGGYQIMKFDSATVVDNILQGGHALEAEGGWRHSISERLNLGAQYGIRRAVVVGDTTAFVIHSIQGAVDYALSPSWSVAALAGVSILASNSQAEGQAGPAVRFTVSHHRESLTLRAWYLRAYTPSFAFGGTVTSQELAFGLRTPLFHSRQWYTDQSAEFRDDEPLTNALDQLPLRSFRTNSVVGYSPQPWIRIEGFYSRVQQSTLRVGGQVYRNRIGVQIVTSKPMRMGE
jgi:hypothetical protein